ncbi:hypothetical protein CDAR_448721 [Caerostris darwini]|uniref:Uncharacterized protein n=1 Tax=Caerostris darwini TaxID=1538125 RepID=A0AAV4QJY8_9ARAC|nr:hypothetical protein CDAR_448721 [Caerostris darwini]
MYGIPEANQKVTFCQDVEERLSWGISHYSTLFGKECKDKQRQRNSYFGMRNKLLCFWGRVKRNERISSQHHRWACSKSPRSPAICGKDYAKLSLMPSTLRNENSCQPINFEGGKRSKPAMELKIR